MTTYKFSKTLYGVLITLFIGAPCSSYGSSSPSNIEKRVKIFTPNYLSPSSVGVASFRRGRFGLVVFNSRFAVPLSTLQSQPGFEKARVILLPYSTVIINPVGPDQFIKVKSGTASWSLAIEQRKILFIKEKYLLASRDNSLVSHLASRSIIVPDPVTGDPILVGTDTRTTAVRSTFRDSGYTICRTWRGTAIHALSDEDQLVFDNGAIEVVEAKHINPAVSNKLTVFLSRKLSQNSKSLLNLPPSPIEDLRRHLLRAQISLANAPLLDKLTASLHLAQVLLGLGLGPEARGVLQDASLHDPTSVNNILWKRLLALAGLLSDRPQVFARLNDTTPSLEMQLWHGLALAQQGQVSLAAKLIIHGLPIFFSYPKPLKCYFSPIIAEALLYSGHLSAAKSFLGASLNKKTLGLARAQLLEATHHEAKALAAYKKLRQSHDVRVAGIATDKVILLRYSLHHISVQKAASNLSRNLYSWRGPHNELSIRLSLASLRAKAGKWAQSLHGLQRSEKLLPSDVKQLEHEREKLFGELLASGQITNLNQLEAITVIKENEDLVPKGAKGEATLKFLAHKLLALDLPEMAVPVIKNLLSRTALGRNRSNLELLLARADLHSHDFRGAENALSHIHLEAQNYKIVARRNFILSEVKAREGDVSGALKAVSDARDSSSLAFKSRLQLAAHHWKAAEVTLRKQINKQKPTTGTLRPNKAALVEQLVMAASNAGDAPELAALRDRYSNRMSNVRQNQILEALTTPTVKPSAGLSEAISQIASIERLGTAISLPNTSTTTPPSFAAHNIGPH